MAPWSLTLEPAPYVAPGPCPLLSAPTCSLLPSPTNWLPCRQTFLPDWSSQPHFPPFWEIKGEEGRAPLESKKDGDSTAAKQVGTMFDARNQGNVLAFPGTVT